MMGSVNSLSDTSSEVASLGINDIMKPTPQNDSNAASAMNQPTDAEVFRFLDLPPEIRNKIYGNLLIYHEPVTLNTIYIPDDRETGRVIYSARLGLAPQICRASKKVAVECFAVLYGENTFHLTSDIRLLTLYAAGIDNYFHYFRTVVMDTFWSSSKGELQHTALSGQSTHLPDAGLLIGSGNWVIYDHLIGQLKNLKTLRLNLPPGLENLTEFNRDALLEIKPNVPKQATVEFYGAASHIVSQLMTAWLNHVPKPIKSELKRRYLQRFRPLEWCEERAAKQDREKSRSIFSLSVSTCQTTQTPALKRPPLDRYFAEDPRSNKRRKLNEEIPHYDLSPFGSSPERIGSDETKDNTEARFLASEDMKLAAEEKALAGEEETLASKEKGLAEEKIALEKKRLVFERSRLALENRKLAIKDEKAPPSPASTVSI